MLWDISSLKSFCCFLWKKPNNIKIKKKKKKKKEKVGLK